MKLELLLILNLDMIISNNSKNTLHLEDIDEFIPYEDGKHVHVDPDMLKKSRSLRNAIINGIIDIVEYDPNERIESSLVYLLNKMRSTKSEKIDTSTPEINQPENILPPETDINGDGAEIKIHGLFYDSSGYAKVNRNLALQLQSLGFNVKIEAKRSQNQLNESELKPFIEMEQKKVSRNHILIDSIIPSFSEIGTGKYRVLYTTIESYTLQDQFISACENYNEIWLTSEWSASILRKYMPDKPIYTVVTGTDPDLYTEEGDRFDFKPNVKDFLFISVFGWNYRKGPDVLCRAYFDEFSNDDNVSLLIMSRYQSGKTRYHREKIKEEIDKYMYEFPNKDMPHVVRFSQMIPERDMPKLYRAGHAFILTTRGEGGGLPPLEASMCGLPVIMTNCSGQQGYLRSDNSYMIDIDRLAPIQPGQMHLHYWDGHEFPALTSDDVHKQVRKSMRDVYENYENAVKRNKRMQNLIRKQFTWKHTGIAAAERLKAISENLKGIEK